MTGTPGTSDDQLDLDGPNRRLDRDRRSRPTRPWDVFLNYRRRQAHRRLADDTPGVVGFVDRHPLALGLMASSLLVLTLVDGAFTVLLLDTDCEEANPLLAHLLVQGPGPFLVAKYALTAAGAASLLTLRTYRLFGTRFRVAYVVPIVFSLYVVLLIYQIHLYYSV